MGWLKQLLGDRVPEGFPGTLAAGEHAVGSVGVEGGGHLVVTALGLWIPDGDGARRVGWHLIGKATWAEGVFTLTETEETGKAGDAVLLADRAPVSFRPAEPSKVPLLVRQRVDGSIRSRYRKEFDGGGGAWFVQRKVPGADGSILQVKPDSGTDAGIVAAIAEEAAAKLANPAS